MIYRKSGICLFSAARIQKPVQCSNKHLHFPFFYVLFFFRNLLVESLSLSLCLYTPFDLRTKRKGFSRSISGYSCKLHEKKINKCRRTHWAMASISICVQYNYWAVIFFLLALSLSLLLLLLFNYSSQDGLACHLNFILLCVSLYSSFPITI